MKDQLDRIARFCFLLSIGVNLVSLSPAVRALFLQQIKWPHIDRWLFLLAFSALMMTGVSLLSLIVPHRINVRWLALTLSLVAGGYAILLAIFTFAGGQNVIIHNLDLSDEFLIGTGFIWTSLMTTLFVIASFAAHWCASNIK